VDELLAQDEVRRARQLCAEGSSHLSRILVTALDHAHLERDALKEKVQEAGRREAVRLQRYLGVVGTVATIEPLLGLLGTVTGMINVFQGVVTQGVGDPSALAAGIWEALITTAAGLTVAIPAYLGWRYLSGRADSLTLELEESVSAVVDQLIYHERPESASSHVVDMNQAARSGGAGRREGRKLGVGGDHELST
jgi:biopolymer transport protein ExbB